MNDQSKCQSVGPRVRVEVKYECNGCQFHSVDQDPESETGLKYHACNHPVVLEQYTTPQWNGWGRESLTIYDTAPTPTHLCPYLAKPRD